EGARAVGMDAILHTDAESLWRELLARGLATEAQRPETGAPVAPTPPDRALWDPDQTPRQRESAE
ncbi:MAG TPA: hypothetical protein VK689_18420, partial [Armatimonadota bacterium]|nr:hypothetical protein [Armatimonadota bacterium]